MKPEFEKELAEILAYWQQYMLDDTYGGFYGKRTADEALIVTAPKGAVLNARILWSFSAAYSHTVNKAYLATADRAYNYLGDRFLDTENGGVFWSVDYEGNPLDTKKQVYAISFAIYALAEYFLISNNLSAREKAIALFQLIEKHSRDKKLGGYIEAFTIDWRPIADLRLSDKDANEKKTMNTHLHILEAYTNLYRVAPMEEVKEGIVHLLQMFHQHIIGLSGHLGLFFDENWQLKSEAISYGHDIEAAWLLSEAAKVLQDDYWISVTNQHAINIAKAAAEGLDMDGGLWHEYDPTSNHWVKEKHWWPQAEAMVGFLHAWEISRESIFLEYVLNSWNFIKEHLLDKQNGEWIWGVHADYSPISTEDKAGFWKCPYHNSRACIEMVRRIDCLTGH